MADKSVESGLAVLPSPHWARDLHGETEVYTAEEVRTFLAHAHAREVQDAAFGAWVRATMQASGPIKTVSGKDVYPVLLPPVDRGAGLDAAIDAAIAAHQQES